MGSIASLDRFQAHSIWEMSVDRHFPGNQNQGCMYPRTICPGAGQARYLDSGGETCPPQPSFSDLTVDSNFEFHAAHTLTED